MVKRFQNRGYPSNLIKHRASIKNDSCRRDKREGGPKNRIPLITTYTNWSNKIAIIINRHWSIVQQSHTNIREFQDRPLLSYRRFNNLRDKLDKSDVGPINQKVQTFLSKPRKGSFPCLSCVNCNYMQKGENLTHPMTGVSFRINYFVTCPCKMVYIGETKNDIKTRINQHRYSIRKNRLDLPVPKHFCECNHHERDLKFMVIEHIPLRRRGGDRLLALKKRELMWIFRLNSLAPNGLNVDYNILPGM